MSPSNPSATSGTPISGTPKKPRLVVLDGNHLIHRAFYAIQAPLSSGGEPTNAVYGFASMLLTILETEKPDHVAVTFDTPKPTFRHEMHTDYKATRVKAPDSLYAQIPRIHEMVQTFGIPVFLADGFEADDLMGTLARKAEANGMEVFIITGDMDALQLISESTHVVFPHKGYREPVVFDAQKVQEKYGVRPDQIVDYKALMGDSSDNLKGVDGIGPTRAAALLSQFGTLDGIYAHLSALAPALRVKLEAGRDQAYFCRTMARIVQDVPLTLDEQKTAYPTLNFAAMDWFLQNLEMNSLRGRLKRLTPEEKRVTPGQMSLF